MMRNKKLYKQRVIIVNNTYYPHSTADDHLFLPASYIEQLEEMTLYDPELHRIARKGGFGVNGILVLPQFETKPHDQVITRYD